MLYGHIPHEERESALIRALSAHCRTMIDVGSHYGWYARLMSERCTRVIGAEPDPMTHRFARANAPRAEVLCAAVGAMPGRASLYLGATRDLNSVVRRVGRSVEVPMVTLDQICDERRLHDVDFVKCDVEGGELTVLEGARRLLSRPNPPIWMIEVSDDFLAQAGTSAGAVARALRTGRDDGAFYGLPHAGEPVRLEGIESSKTGLSNVFYVPPIRRAQFAAAADALLRRSRNEAVRSRASQAIDGGARGDCAWAIA
jgi:FkbM family methyltransferase